MPGAEGTDGVVEPTQLARAHSGAAMEAMEAVVAKVEEDDVHHNNPADMKEVSRRPAPPTTAHAVR